MSRPEPFIESYGATWVCIAVGSRIYEYQASHPDTIRAIIWLVKRKSGWKGLNLAKKECRLAYIHIPEPHLIPNRRAKLYRIQQIFEVKPDIHPLKQLVYLLKMMGRGEGVAYHWNKFFIYKTF